MWKISSSKAVIMLSTNFSSVPSLRDLCMDSKSGFEFYPNRLVFLCKDGGYAFLFNNLYVMFSHCASRRELDAVDDAGVWGRPLQLGYATYVKITSSIEKPQGKLTHSKTYHEE